MKSEKAKQFLETKQPGDIAQYEISRGKAEKAVEIAEAEMREKAIEAFEWWLIEYYTEAECEALINKHKRVFIQQLDKQE